MQQSKIDSKIRRIEKFARFSDSKFRIPKTDIKFGWDFLIGLIPGVGDSISLISSLYLILEAKSLKLPFYKKAHIAFNIFIDWLIGLIPILGDLLDIGFKSNIRNANIIIKHIKNSKIEPK